MCTIRGEQIEANGCTLSAARDAVIAVYFLQLNAELQYFNSLWKAIECIRLILYN